MSPNCENESRSYQLANMALLTECELCPTLLYKHRTLRGATVRSVGSTSEFLELRLRCVFGRQTNLNR